MFGQGSLRDLALVVADVNLRVAIPSCPLVESFCDSCIGYFLAGRHGLTKFGMIDLSTIDRTLVDTKKIPSFLVCRSEQGQFACQVNVFRLVEGRSSDGPFLGGYFLNPVFHL